MKFFLVPALVMSLWYSGALAQPAASTPPAAPNTAPPAETTAATPQPPAPAASTREQRTQEAMAARANKGAEDDPASVVKKDNWVCNLVATRFNIWQLELLLTTLSTYKVDSCSPESMNALTTASAFAQLRAVPGFSTIMKGGASRQIMDINLTPISSEYYWVSNLKFSQLSTSRIKLSQLYQTTKLGSTKNLAGASYVPFKLVGETHYIWNSGSLIHRLVSPEGNAYIMYSYTRDVQPSLSRETLSDLNSMLRLPPGWTFENYFLDKNVVVRAGLENQNSITVIFDDLNNNYVLYE